MATAFATTKCFHESADGVVRRDGGGTVMTRHARSALMGVLILAAGALIYTSLSPHTATAEDTSTDGSPLYVTTDPITGASVQVGASTDDSGDSCLDVNVFQTAVDAPTGSFGGCGFAGVLDTVTGTDTCVTLWRLAQINCPQPEALNIAPLSGSTAINGSSPPRDIAGALTVVTCVCTVTIHFSDGTSTTATPLPLSLAQRLGVPYISFGYRAVSPGVIVDRVDATSTDLGVRISHSIARAAIVNAPISSLPSG